jgi:X-Pro dipeptidyl-peptidase
MMIPLALLMCLSALASRSNFIERTMLSEVVFVESPTDTDKDGKLDRIYISISRPNSDKKLSTIYSISPYATGGNYDAKNHEVDFDFLPQDESILYEQTISLKSITKRFLKSLKGHNIAPVIDALKYAQVRAHSVGTGRSTGCPTVGTMDETLAAKSVIDWLNGRARAFYENGLEAKAEWANGNVGMTGTSYDGTLPIMVATTGVEGLKAIVPIAAISNWYDYYRANGLVVNPGGYIGEDADVLGYFIARKGSCNQELKRITQTMGRENGDFTKFWADRDYVSLVKNIKAATFIIHGQDDWNVKQKNAIQLWEALEGIAPRRMFLHKGGHGSTYSHSVPKKLQAWFDHFLEGVDNGITSGAQVEVELPDGSLMVQENWPHENSVNERFYLSSNFSLELNPAREGKLTIVDVGNSKRVESLMENPTQRSSSRLVFLTDTFDNARVLSGTPKMTLRLAVKNRKAGNITVVIVEYSRNGRGRVITRGWADPQNHRDPTQGELLVPGKTYDLSFDLEPKQSRIEAGSRLGVLVTSTDYEYTLRPKEGTEIEFSLGAKSFIEMGLSRARER